MDEGVDAIAAGDNHSMVLKKDGSVWSTGNNEHGQLGDGTTNKHAFIKVIDDGVVAIAAGSKHSMVLKKDGSVWCTGNNEHGQLGDGSTAGKNAFTMVIDDGVVAIAAGGDDSMVLKADGSVWTTGKKADASTTDENGLGTLSSLIQKAAASKSDCAKKDTPTTDGEPTSESKSEEKTDTRPTHKKEPW